MSKLLFIIFLLPLYAFGASNGSENMILFFLMWM